MLVQLLPTPVRELTQLLTVQYFPSWFPGTRYATHAKKWKPIVRRLYDDPVDKIRRDMVSRRWILTLWSDWFLRLVGRKYCTPLFDKYCIGGVTDIERRTQYRGYQGCRCNYVRGWDRYRVLLSSPVRGWFTERLGQHWECSLPIWSYTLRLCAKLRKRSTPLSDQIGFPSLLIRKSFHTLKALYRKR